MGLDCCCRFLKIIVVVVNILIVIVGVAALALGIFMLISSNEIERSKQEGVKYLVVICATIIAVGVLLFIVGFMGCCGAAFENQCLLGTFIFFMALALGVVIAGAVLIGDQKHKDDIIEESGKLVENMFKELNQENSEIAGALQDMFKCCGSSGYKDWTAVKLQVPVSCCVDTDNKCSNDLSKQILFRKGCKLVIKGWVEYFITISPLILGLAGIAETLAMVTTLGLCCYIRKGAY